MTDSCRALATYRLQFHADFQFEAARRLVPYLSRLGITHLYSSPICRARKGSKHGYDVTDPTTINPFLGDETSLRELVATLRNFGLELLLDIVPNHMAATLENPYWRDVLTYGPHSPYAHWFDIDWRRRDSGLWGRVLLPVLSQPISQVLAGDELQVVWHEGRFALQYLNHRFPLHPSTVPEICGDRRREVSACHGLLNPLTSEMHEVLAELVRLRHSSTRKRGGRECDRDQCESLLSRLAQILTQSPCAEKWAHEAAQTFGSGDDGRLRLKKLLDAQTYRLAYWRQATRILNYRRFFDINDLISVRQEDPQVFDETHALIRRWLQDGLISGLRVDHVDGLRDPLTYLRRLHDAVNASSAERAPPFVLVEKIVAPGERLPLTWRVQGTTGYEFLSQMEDLFVSPTGWQEMVAQYRRLVPRSSNFHRVARRAKRRVLRQAFSATVDRLVDSCWQVYLYRIALPFDNQRCSSLTSAATHANMWDGPSSLAWENQTNVDAAQGTRGLTKADLRHALVETIAALPVYRTYIDGRSGQLTVQDRKFWKRALRAAADMRRVKPQALHFLHELLIPSRRMNWSAESQQLAASIVERLQQVTGPAAAKGIEDTAFYTYVPLVSRNEVGGVPSDVSTAAAYQLHKENRYRLQHWPRTLLTVTTHDTKRSADARARLDVLSEIPSDWWLHVRRWRGWHRALRTRLRRGWAPDAVTEYLFYQTVLAIWPLSDPGNAIVDSVDAVDDDFRQRVDEYMRKAIREAKTVTSWVTPHTAYEEAVSRFVNACLDTTRPNENRFLRDMQDFAAGVVRPGLWNSLSRTVIQFTAPGTPDLFQGDELWNFALVDPDNRRAVDFDHRIRLLDELIERSEVAPSETYLQQLTDYPENGQIKMYVVHRLLQMRRTVAPLFYQGEYRPLNAEGPYANHVFAFARCVADRAIIVIVPRLTATLVKSSRQAPLGAGVWGGETCLPLPADLQGYEWRGVLDCHAWPARRAAPSLDDCEPSGRSAISIAEALRWLPVAVLVGTASDG